MTNSVLVHEYEDMCVIYLDTWSGPTASEVQGYYPQATRNFLAGVTITF